MGRYPKRMVNEDGTDRQPSLSVDNIVEQIENESGLLYEITGIGCDPFSKDPLEETSIPPQREANTTTKIRVQKQTMVDILISLWRTHHLQTRNIQEDAIADCYGTTALMMCEKYMASQTWQIDVLADQSVLCHIMYIITQCCMRLDNYIDVTGDLDLVHRLRSWTTQQDTRHEDTHMIYRCKGITNEPAFLKVLLTSKMDKKPLIWSHTTSPLLSMPLITAQKYPTTSDLDDMEDIQQGETIAAFDDNKENEEPYFVDEKRKFRKVGPKKISAQLKLKQREVSCLIGLNGRRLNSIREMSGCCIKVLPVNTDKEGGLLGSLSRRETSQTITITGYKANVEDALATMEHYVVVYRQGDSKFM
ncbi:uncharacterized protein RJT20DRAFT_131219 [Scheffersomyces xylosifermentans]|uniref:uncharacterized protein n=1 Tax=Scheffersomyces xylosifermentans TaxID=1304137 RepID=UPI00315DFFC7